MNRLVKFLKNDDGDKIEEPKWCLVEFYGDAPRTVCSGECFGEGESGVEYEEKLVKRNGITCSDCLRKLKWYKSIIL